MTLDQFQRAQLAAFAWREAFYTGNLNCMRAVCYVIRNRVKAGWFGGSWMEILNHTQEVSGNDSNDDPIFDLSSPRFHTLLREIDDIYFGTAQDETSQVVGEAVYYQFIDRPLRSWFVEHVARDPENHPRGANIGNMRLYL